MTLTKEELELIVQMYLKSLGYGVANKRKYERSVKKLIKKIKGVNK